MKPERAQEILTAIYNSPFQWQGDTDKHFLPRERQQVIEKWKTMPSYTCFVDALQRIANCNL